MNAKPLSFLFFIVGLLFLNGVFISSVMADDDHGGEHPHWSYANIDQWGDYEAICATGERQSPINILEVEEANLPDIHFDYHAGGLSLENNGHTVQAHYDEGSSITVNGVTYQLNQFHFHHHSEHRIEGVVFPLEVHFVHTAENGDRAVIGVLFTERTEPNLAYGLVLDRLPTIPYSGTYHYTGITINAADLMPENHRYIGYDGSLTTPPCTENVRWLVMTTPVQLSTEQIEAFRRLYANNARPPQSIENTLMMDSGADS